MLTYTKRRNLFVKGERQWRIEPDALVQRDEKGQDTRWPWKDVKSIRLSFSPTQQCPFRHATIIHLKNGRKVEFDNVHFLGLASFEDRSGTYSPFAREVVQRVAKYAPDAEAHTGATMAGYVALIVLLVAVFVVMAGAMVLIPLGDWPGTAWAKFGILLLLLPVLWTWVRKARPRGIKLSALPADALP
jgi:hypothetical protein